MLIDEIQQKINQLDSALKLLNKNGIDLAKKERDYKITLRTEALKLREEGMAVTLIDQIIYGVPQVAKLRFERDVAKTNYDTNIEFINSIKLQLRLMEGQASRDWSRAKDE